MLLFKIGRVWIESFCQFCKILNLVYMVLEKIQASVYIKFGEIDMEAGFLYASDYSQIGKKRILIKVIFIIIKTDSR